MATDITAAGRISPRPEFAGILRRDETYATGRNSEAVGERVNGWFDRLVMQSGLETSPATVLVLSLFAAMMLGGMAFVIQENLLTTALAAMIGGAIPIATVVYLRQRRQRQILDQMPGMIAELARAARTGRSLEQCFEIAANDTPAPLGRDLQLCTRKMQLGLPLPEAIDNLPERTGVTSMSVFVTALKVHHQTGGDLVRVLERLSHTIRDRIMFLGRLRAATTASKATAILMIGLPPAILAFFVFRDPEYLSSLMDSTWGRYLTIFAVLLQVIGSVWVLRILQNSQRT